MRLAVCHGEVDPEVAHNALISVRRPFYVVTMHEMWWEVAAEDKLPRLWFDDKLWLMRYVLRVKSSICLLSRDKTDETMSFGASMYAMDVPIWEVA